MTEELKIKGSLAKEAAFSLSKISTDTKNKALETIAEALLENTDEILLSNKKDLETAEKNGMKKAMLDRLSLTPERIQSIAKGVLQVVSLSDPVGEVISMTKRPNGLMIGQKRVPMGVIAIIYEARPNVTVDAAILCLKTSNAVILRGGSEAINTNIKLMEIMQKAAYSVGIPEGSLNILEDTSRETATALMKMNGYVDLLIPRGGKGLIRAVVENATVPVIETAAGNCHIYIDSESDKEMAKNILINAKVSRPSVCNAAETLLIDEKCDEAYIKALLDELSQNGVEIIADEKISKLYPDSTKAEDEDWYTEYNDLKITAGLVSGIDEAISHINKYNTKHSEAIITTNYNKAQKFLNEVDAAAVYVNASTRFTDGFEFGFGAEIGISTQKMHARGPMGLLALTSVKYIVYGDGQIR